MRRWVVTSKFSLGNVVVTQGIYALMEAGELNPYQYLQRHEVGDWGDLEKSDLRANEQALKHDGRLFSAYNTSAGRIWIITEWNRSATTILLPSEY